MAKLVYLYTFNKYKKDFKRFDKIELSEDWLKRAKSDPEITEYIPVWVKDSPRNQILEDVLNLGAIWVSPNEGEVISTGELIVIWFDKPNDSKAIQKFINYQKQMINDYVEAIKKSLTDLYDCLGHLYLHKELVRPAVYRCPIDYTMKE